MCYIMYGCNINHTFNKSRSTSASTRKCYESRRRRLGTKIGISVCRVATTKPEKEFLVAGTQTAAQTSGVGFFCCFFGWVWLVRINMSVLDFDFEESKN